MIKKNIHFVGIGGAGMSGIAEVLLHDGYHVSGSDLNESEVTDRLKKMGAVIYIGHHADHIIGVDRLVASTAIHSHNPEIQAAKLNNVPILKRAEMLAEIMKTRYGIAIAGSHGKTTTTSLLASILIQAGVDPTFIIGGKLKSAQAHGRLGKGNYLIAEADESDASFLYLSPQISVVTSISQDHLVNYDQDFKKLKKAFVHFIQQLPVNGLAVLCVDDPEVVDIIPSIERPIMTYGFSPSQFHFPHFQVVNLQSKGTQMMFDVARPEKSLLPIKLNIPGKHNILNATAAVVVATYLNLSDVAINNALEDFQGIYRRFEILGLQKILGREVVMVDDYGHHPREIETTIEAVRQSWPDKKIAMVFQPHRYTRTHDLFNEFVRILQKVDQLYLLPVYAASEEPIPGATSEHLQELLAQNAFPAILLNNANALEKLNETLLDRSVLLMQGAGGDVANLVVKLLHMEPSE